MQKSIFFHAGCSVCLTAEKEIIELIGKDQVEIIHLGEKSDQIANAEAFGVKSVPALVTPNQNVLHINFGASIEAIKS